MKRFAVYVVVVALLLTGCGGSADEPAETESGTAEQTSTAAPADTTTETSDSSKGETATTTTVAVNALGDGNEDTTFYGNPPGTATVEVGDIKYEFDLSMLCLTMGGAMGVAGQATDGSDVSVDADFPPENWAESGDGWEPPSISIDDAERDKNWVAGGIVAGSYPDGASQVDSFNSDGRLATGEATFVNVYTFGDSLESASGTFEFHCPEG